MSNQAMKRHRGLNHCSGHPKLMQYYKSAILQLRYTHTHTHTHSSLDTHTHTHKNLINTLTKRRKKRDRGTWNAYCFVKKASLKSYIPMIPTVWHYGKSKTMETIKKKKKCLLELTEWEMMSRQRTEDLCSRVSSLYDIIMVGTWHYTFVQTYRRGSTKSDT